MKELKECLYILKVFDRDYPILNFNFQIEEGVHF